MRTKDYRGRTYDADSRVEEEGVFRGVFDVDSTSKDVTDGVINEATSETFPTHEAADEAAATAAQRWIDSEINKDGAGRWSKARSILELLKATSMRVETYRGHLYSADQRTRFQ